MKRMSLVLLMLSVLFILPAQAQFAWLWGDDDELVWGTTFKNTDQLKIVTSVTQIDTSDTVYCNLIQIPGEVLGTQNIAVSFDSVDAPSDSVQLDFRFYYNKDVHTSPLEWGLWKPLIGNIKTDSLYVLQLADSSWWAPANGYQFRAYRLDADKDTCSVPHMSIYGN